MLHARRYGNVSLLLLAILVVFALGVVLQELQAVLLPFVIATLLSIIFRPVVLRLRDRGVPLLVVLFLVLLVSLLVLFLLGLVLYSSTGAFLNALPRYEARFEGMLRDGWAWVQTLAARFDIPTDGVRPSEIVQLTVVSSAVATGVGTFLVFGKNVFLVLLFMLFILSGTGHLSAKIRAAFPTGTSDRIARVVENISAQVRQYLLTKTLVSLSTGILVGLVLWLLGVDFPLIWGCLAFLLNFIPSIGSIVATVLPFALSLLQFDTIVTPMLVLVLLGGIQVTIGNILEPRFMAFSLDLSALLVIVSLIFWGWLWGVWGMLLAVPITATMKIVFENIDALRPVSVLMSGRVTP